MYICICNAVTDTDILDAVDNGAHDIEEVGNRLGAGTGCGTCRDAAQSLIDQALASSLSYAA